MRRWEKYYIVIMLCIAAGVSIGASDEGDAVALVQSDRVALLLQMVEYGVMVALCYLHKDVLLKHLRELRGPLPIALLALASSAWSILPSFTFSRSVILLLVTTLGFYIGALMTPVQLHRFYARFFGLMIVLSVLVIVLIPSSGISHGEHSGDWRGAFYHKNRLGEIMGLAFITFGFFPPADMTTLRRWGLALASLVLLYKSHAGTDIVAIAVVLAAQVFWYLFLMSRKAILAVLLCGYPLVLLAVGAISANLSSVLGLLGKDATFTGRDRLWAGVLDAIKLRPILGYGFQSFFVDRGGMTVLIREKTTFVPIHAHDGYLNLILHVGIVGLLLFLVFLAQALVVAVRERRGAHHLPARWYYSFIIAMVFINLTESQTLESPMIWMTLIAFYTSLSIQRSRVTATIVESEQPIIDYGMAHS